MNARFSKSVVSVMLIASLALAIVPFAGAQEGPPQVGLRPDAPPYALHGPYWVGTRELVIEPESERPLPLTVWYPALNPDGVTEEITYVYDNFVSIEGFTLPGHAIADAAPDTADGPYPLVILSHGLCGYRYNLAYLGEHLASHGFLVMAVDHTGDTLGYVTDPELRKEDWSGFAEAFLNAFIYRPADVQRQIDYAALVTAQDGDLPGLIDTDHIAVVGHSLGGYTALTAAGAQVDLGPLKPWCAENAGDPVVAANDLYVMGCQILSPSESQLLTMHGIEANAGGMWPPFDVTGVDAIVPLSLSAVFGTESFENVTVPALLVVGTDEYSLDLNHEHALMIYENLASDHKGLVVFDNANHFFPQAECIPWFYDQQNTGACATDAVWDIHRAHDLINHFTTAFLLSTLKDDAEAAAALAPDAVQFPGITYEAQGF